MLCLRLARYGVAARHLRAFRSAVGREAGLLEQILAPSLRSSTPTGARPACRSSTRWPS